MVVLMYISLVTCRDLWLFTYFIWRTVYTLLKNFIYKVFFLNIFAYGDFCRLNVFSKAPIKFGRATQIFAPGLQILRYEGVS